MNCSFTKVVATCLVLFLCTINISAKKKNAETPKDTLINSELVSGLKFRNIGPAWASGRIADFAMHPTKPSTYYVAVASGNVFKTLNNGTTWKPIFDNYGSYSTSVIKLDPNNPNVVWLGTGENNHQRALGYGDGVYKSLDGGKSFTNMGLKKSMQIGGIVIDPRNSNVVFVAAEGSVWGPGGERGLYKSTDGGKTWNKTLEISENTGVNNIVMDPSNPDILYATSEQRRRHHFGRVGGGPESSVYKSTDNGENWRKIVKGLPKVHIGGMGIDVSPVDPNTLYLIMEAADDKSGFYRSTNKGESWNKMSSHASSGQYYNEIYCSPHDVNTVYSVETYTQVSKDAGKTWHKLGNNKRHVDDHALWLDPANADHMLIGSDGGIYESYDHGAHWDFKENLPITQFYRVAVDDAYPFYNVYGGTQDNNSMGGPSASIYSDGVVNDEWTATLGGDGFWQAIEPGNPNIVYSEYQYGNVYRHDKQSGENISVKPRERKDEKAYKWNWDAPMFLSTHNSQRLYMAANKVFRSDDRGNSWQVISDDLTSKTDRNAFKYMDEYWGSDAVQLHVSTSQWGTIVSMDESKVQEGLLYVGTDDGVISVTEDNGENWHQVKSFPGVPKLTYVSDIQADKFDKDVVYATFKNLKRDDFKPYVLKSSDKGRTWSNIATHLPDNEPVHTIAQDFRKPELLFVGTEFGLYFSIDAGANWTKLKSGLPTIAIRDIAIQERESDLVLASFGRGFFILDNYAPLRELSHEVIQNKAVLFPIKDALQYVQKKHFGNQGSTYYLAPNPKYGATFTYFLKDVAQSTKQARLKQEKETKKKGEAVPHPTWRKLQLEGAEEKAHLIFTIRDAENKVVRKITKAPSKGVQRLTWDLRYPSVLPVSTSKFDPLKASGKGRVCKPGNYTVSLALWDKGTLTNLVEPTAFKVEKLENSTLKSGSPHAFNAKVEALQVNYYATAKSLGELQKKMATITQTLYNSNSASEELKNKSRLLSEDLEALHFILEGVPAIASWEEVPPAQMPLSKRVSEMAYSRSSSSAAPTQTEQDLFEIIQSELHDVIQSLNKIAKSNIQSLEKELDAINAPWTPGRLPKIQ